MRLEAIVADEAIFRAWYDAVLPRVYRYLLSRCGHDVALAEELTQQTFVEAIRRRRQFDGRSDAVTWLCTIGRNKLVDHFRHAGRDQRRQLRLLDGGNDPGARVQAPRMIDDQLPRRFGSLPDASDPDPAVADGLFDLLRLEAAGVAP